MGRIPQPLPLKFEDFEKRLKENGGVFNLMTIDPELYRWHKYNKWCSRVVCISIALSMVAFIVMIISIVCVL